MWISYKWCNECNGYKIDADPPRLLRDTWGYYGTDTAKTVPCVCVPKIEDDKHKKMLDRSMIEYADIWTSLGKK